MDNLTQSQRSENMRRIKSKDTQIEVILRKELWKRGFRYRKNDKRLPGKPDISILKYKIAIFCDGEFFHEKNWEIAQRKLRKSNNSNYWLNKISKNIERDTNINKQLNYMGWKVIRLWGDDIKNNMDECIRTIEDAVFDRRMEDV